VFSRFHGVLVIAAQSSKPRVCERSFLGGMFRQATEKLNAGVVAEDVDRSVLLKDSTTMASRVAFLVTSLVELRFAGASA
jgi:hypothetical protein